MANLKILVERFMDNPGSLLLKFYLFALVYIPFHIFLSQWIGLLIGGLNFWKVAKDILVILLFLSTTIAVIAKNKQKEWLKFKSLIVLVVGYGALHIATFLLNQKTTANVAILATVYNNRFFWLFLSGINLSILINKQKTQKDILIKLIIAVSTVVCFLGLLQWFLPKDILSHFGYSVELGVKPNFFINENPNYPRVFSTLRDPNSFGAYLLVPILLIVQLLIKSKKRLMFAGLLMLHLLVLLLSFSRASWGGLLITLLVLVVLKYREQAKKITIKYKFIIVGFLAIGLMTTYSIRHTPTFRSLILKANDTNSASELDSDELHLDFVKKGTSGIVKNPLGDGPGTAGIVSIQNKNGGRLTENYYIQIALEVGVIGLMLFLSIWTLVMKKIFQQPQDILSITLLCTAVGYAVMALVMHLWANEAVAYTWWGLAGLAIYDNISKQKKVKS